MVTITAEVVHLSTKGIEDTFLIASMLIRFADDNMVFLEHHESLNVLFFEDSLL